jgi:Terminase small subunit
MVNKPGPLPEPRKGKNRSSPRQKKFLQELPKHKTVAEAAIAAGYSPKNASQSGYQALKQVRGRVPDLMDRIGISEEVLIEKHLARHLVKTKTEFVREEVVVKKRVKVGRGKQARTETREVVRHVVKQYQVDDNNVQLMAMDKGFLLHGSYAPRDPKEAAQFGVKVIVQDLGLLRGANGRPPIDIKPGMDVPSLTVGVQVTSGGKKKPNGSNGHGDD